jgi:hypothetical protein
MISMSRRWRLFIPIGVLVVLLVGIAALRLPGNGGASPHEPEEAKSQTTPTRLSASASPPSKDGEFRKLVVGTWQDEYQGKRTLTLREGGTGTMVVELSGLKATLVAPRLTFNMEWTVADGRLKKHSLGGEPAAKINMILKTMGDTVDEEILELTEDRMLLLDQDGKTKYDWRRVR